VAIVDKEAVPILQDGDEYAEVIEDNNQGADEPIIGEDPEGEYTGLDENVDGPIEQEHIEDAELDKNVNEQINQEHIEDTRSEDDDDNNGSEGDNEGVDEEQPAPRSEEQVARNLRPNRERNYEHRLGHIMNNPANSQSYDAQFLQHGTNDAPTNLRVSVQEMQRTGSNTNVPKCITGLIMTQMTVKAGIKKHGQVTIDALFKEFSRLHDLGIFLAQDAKTLTSAQKK
jgi:hypothetical protein